MENKVINRESSATKIFDDRSLAVDYRTLVPFLKKDLRILDVGCGTGSITKDIADLTGPRGRVTGIDNTEKFITAGKLQFSNIKNLELICTDLFRYETDDKFDLIVSARTMQWLSNVSEALIKMKSMLKPGGTLSVLDYNHTKADWQPEPPASMRKFYEAFLKWREDAGMNNHVADDLPGLFNEAGFTGIQVFNSDEHYRRSDENFPFRAAIWSKVAELKQIAEEGYVTEEERLKAIADYNTWIAGEGRSVTMKLNEIRGIKGIIS
ncbi:MAG TPA: methyltransferase domain-containing protein [Cyclobacteriaceae bacterium]|nr:methyltransferase domain-containing protein [Cyclobacteriaceae bacterium]